MSSLSPRNVCYAGCLALFAVATASAQVGSPKIELVADVGSPGEGGIPRLRPEALPVLGGAFSLGVDHAAPSSFGKLFFSVNESSLPLPGFGATALPGLPLLFQDFFTDAGGEVSGLAGLAVVDAALVGLEFVTQAVIADAFAQGGIAFSEGVRLRFAPPMENPFSHRLMKGVVATGSLQWADVDQDGQADLVAVGGTKLSVYRADGSGGFLSGFNPTVGLNPRELAVSDFNGDGDPDLAVPTDSTDITLLLGSTGQSFDIQSLPFQHSVALYMKASDLDGDGNADLLYGGNSSVIYARLGNGDGTFGTETQQILQDGLLKNRFQLVDYDFDGLPDLVAQTGSKLRVYFNQGAGQFSMSGMNLPLSHNLPSSAEQVLAFDVADSDSDGDLEVLCASSSTGNSYRVELLEVGPSQSQTLYNEVFFGTVETISALDLNGDGLQDYLLSEPEASWKRNRFFIRSVGEDVFEGPIVQWSSPLWSKALAMPPDGIAGNELLVNGEGRIGFRPMPSSDEPAARLLGSSGTQAPARPVVFDWDQNGVEDVTFPCTGQTLLREADGSWTTVGAAFQASGECLVTDFDSDGVSEISFMKPVIGGLRLDSFESQGDGTFALDSFFYPQAVGNVRWSTIDLNGDSVQDFVIAWPGESALRFYRGVAPGAFAVDQELFSVGMEDDLYEFFQVGDVIGDEREEVLLISNGEVRVYGQGAGATYELLQVVQSATGFGDALHLELADVDGDGLQDLVLLDGGSFSGPQNLFVHLGSPAGFDPQGTLVGLGPGSPYSFGSISADFDGDGIVDILAHGYLLSLYRGGVIGSSATLEQYPRFVEGDGSLIFQSDANFLVPFDFDNDGDLDLLSSEGQALQGTFSNPVSGQARDAIYFSRAVRPQ